MQLKEQFLELMSNYSTDIHYNTQCWNQISKYYSGDDRHYHNLEHLNTMIAELETVKPNIQQWDTILFSVYYHDVIYRATRKNNEAKSAEFMQQHLQKTTFPNTANCFQQILATKQHQNSDDEDTNYLLDADLVVLGKPWTDYLNYTQNIRTEYKIYPDILYIPGRRKVLQHFLSFEFIYKTPEFREKYERQAKENLKRELDQT